MRYVTKFLNIMAFVTLTYSLLVVINVESMNSQEVGGILQNWHRQQRFEYPGGCCGSGIGKMRGQGDFQDFLTVFGLPAYPACIFSIIIFFLEARRNNTNFHRALFYFCFVLSAAILARFMWLGVFSAGAGIG